MNLATMTLLLIACELFGSQCGAQDGPHLFNTSSCLVEFGDVEVQLTYVDETYCSCPKKEPYVWPGFASDGKTQLNAPWRYNGRDGSKPCTVTQGGPCGDKNGVKLECEGVKYTCLNNICQFPPSAINGPCGDERGCETGLICGVSGGGTCIKLRSTKDGKACKKDEECVSGFCECYACVSKRNKTKKMTSEYCDDEENGGCYLIANFWLVLISIVY